MIGRLLHSPGGRNALFLPLPYYAPGGPDWEVLDPVFPPGHDPDGPANVEEYWFVHDFVEALDQGRDHECSGAVGRHVMEIMMGLFESAAYGRRVALPQQDRSHPLLRWRREHGLGLPGPVPRGYLEWEAAEDRRLGRDAP